MRCILLEKYQKPSKTLDGALIWENESGQMHRRNGFPAYSSFFTAMWSINGKYHRSGDKPAITRRNPFFFFYLHDRPDHIPYPEEEYWVNGIRHRDDDKPAIIYPNGSLLIWCKNGEIHRDFDKPAIINKFSKSEIYYKNGAIHRDGGKPAEITKYYEFYYENDAVVKRKINYWRLFLTIVSSNAFVYTFWISLYLAIMWFATII